MYSTTELKKINEVIRAVVDQESSGFPRHDLVAVSSGERVVITEEISDSTGLLVKVVRPRGRASSSTKGVVEALRSHLVKDDHDNTDPVVKAFQQVMRRSNLGSVELFNRLQVELSRSGF